MLRQFVGKCALLGFDSLDYWNQSVNERVLSNQLKKLDKDAKKQLAENLLAEAEVAGPRPLFATAETTRAALHREWLEIFQFEVPPEKGTERPPIGDHDRFPSNSGPV